MSKQFFPAEGQSYTYLQTNRSDDLGSLWATVGFDLQSNLGALRIAPRMLVASNTANTENLGLPVAFTYVDGYLWTVAGSRVFKNGTTPNSNWTEDASTGAQTDYSAASDLAIFDTRLWSSTADALYSKALNGSGSGAWTSRDTLSSSANILVPFPQFNRLYYQQSNGVVKSIDTSNVVSTDAYQINFGTGQVISAMVANSTFIWIGISATTANQGSVAKIYAWDGISTAASKVYTLPTRYIRAMTVYEDIVYMMDGRGILYKFDGYTFTEIGRLPYPNIDPATNPAYIHRNGLIPTKNGTIFALITNKREPAGSSTDVFQENVSSGIWEWSKDFGFTHHFSASYTPGTGSTTLTDFGQNIVEAVGALFDVSEIFTSTANDNGTTIAGIKYYTNAADSTYGIFVDDRNDTLRKKGYFVTTWFYSEEIQDKWLRWWSSFKKMLDSNDNIVFKYRVTEEPPLMADITWVNAFTFTTTTNPSAYWTSGQGVGGEVEVLQGQGAGSCAHIGDITSSMGTYTVSIDQAIATTSAPTGTARVRFQKWVKLNPSINASDTPEKIYEQNQIGVTANRIQFKGCFTFTGEGEFFKGAVFSNEDIKVSP